MCTHRVESTRRFLHEASEPERFRAQADPALTGEPWCTERNSEQRRHEKRNLIARAYPPNHERQTRAEADYERGLRAFASLRQAIAAEQDERGDRQTSEARKPTGGQLD